MIAAPMPGLSANDITVTIGDDRRVILQGELCSAGDYPHCGELKGVKDVVLDEWSPGPYVREIELPMAVDGSAGRVKLWQRHRRRRAADRGVDDPREARRRRARQGRGASEESFPRQRSAAWTGTTVRPAGS